VRKVTERMGGRVGLESDEGSGSRFWLELRAAGGVVSSADRRGGVA
jgi:signal transduction histidine kinase